MLVCTTDSQSERCNTPGSVEANAHAWPWDLLDHLQDPPSSLSGILLTGFLSPLYVGEWNGVKWKPRPSLHAQEFQSLSDGEEGKTILLWSKKNDPLCTQWEESLCPQCHFSFLGWEQRLNLSDFRHSSQARFQQFPSEIKSSEKKVPSTMNGKGRVWFAFLVL